jgi:regulator of RNase E activity RraA
MDTWIEYLMTVDTPTLSNAIEVCGVRRWNTGFAPLGIRCLFPELGRLAGYAVTAQVETMTQTEPRDNRRFLELYQLVQQSPKPAVVVLQEIGAFPSYAAHCGEIMATFFTRLGAVGLVSDCGVRDLPEVRAMGFHYFARGAVASHAYFRIVRAGVPVQILGLEVRPGDILHGDENGLISVPAGLETRLPEAVAQVRSTERGLMDWIKGPRFNLEGWLDRKVE